MNAREKALKALAEAEAAEKAAVSKGSNPIRAIGENPFSKYNKEHGELADHDPVELQFVEGFTSSRRGTSMITMAEVESGVKRSYTTSAWNYLQDSNPEQAICINGDGEVAQMGEPFTIAQGVYGNTAVLELG